MMTLYKSDRVEREIESLRRRMDALLDLRKVVDSEEELREVDFQLASIAQSMIYLEI
ncbi:hypothetical protein D3C73_1486470 [compost metagenome]